MAYTIRKIIASVLVLLLIVGAIFAYIQTGRMTQIQASVQTPLCGNTYPSKIAPSSTNTQTCPISSNSWFKIRLSGNGNFNLTVLTSQNSTAGGDDQRLYSYTGSNLSASFPVYVNSSATVLIQNLETKPLALNGYVNVTAENQTTVSMTTPSHELRDAGVLLILGSLVGLFFLILDTERVSRKRNYVAARDQARPSTMPG